MNLQRKKDLIKSRLRSCFYRLAGVLGKYPEKLFSALMNSQTVISAWCGDELVGLIRALDDGAMVAFLHYALVKPEFQGRGIAGELLRRIKEKYAEYLYIELMPDQKKNVPFYEKHGFCIMPEGTALYINNTPDEFK